jgi:hypothetical protein
MTPWFEYQLSLSVGTLLLSLPFIYVIRILRRKEAAGEGNYTLRIYALCAFVALMVCNSIAGLFEKPPSKEQIQSMLNTSNDNGQKWLSWQLAHPYVMPLVILILSLGAFAYGLAMLFRTARRGGLGGYLMNPFAYFCVGMVIAFVALFLSFFRL